MFSDWKTGYGLTVDGEVLGSPDDDWAHAGKVTDPVQKYAVLAQAAVRFPELSHLRPERQPGDPDCRTCNERWRVPAVPEHDLCLRQPRLGARRSIAEQRLMATAFINRAVIHDWGSFYDECVRELGFPAFYGRNMISSVPTGAN